MPLLKSHPCSVAVKWPWVPRSSNYTCTSRVPSAFALTGAGPARRVTSQLCTRGFSHSAAREGWRPRRVHSREGLSVCNGRPEWTPAAARPPSCSPEAPSSASHPAIHPGIRTAGGVSWPREEPAETSRVRCTPERGAAHVKGPRPVSEVAQAPAGQRRRRAVAASCTGRGGRRLHVPQREPAAEAGQPRVPLRRPESPPDPAAWPRSPSVSRVSGLRSA